MKKPAIDYEVERTSLRHKCDEKDFEYLQIVDDPRLAVQQADELVAQVIKSLAETFSNERTKLEAQVDQTDKASTENLRLALRHYRSFFERLLSL